MLDQEALAAFWSHVDKSGNCWLWTGNTGAGYGQFYWKGVDYGAHRLSWELVNGPISKGLVICHDCDQYYPIGDTTYRRCVKPSHLFVGTQHQNVLDASKKGRLATGDRNASRLYHDRLPHGKQWEALHLESLPRGEDHWKAKLNEEAVRKIRQLYSLGSVTTYTLAEEFGVTATNVQYIINRKTWRHVL